MTVATHHTPAQYDHAREVSLTLAALALEHVLRKSYCDLAAAAVRRGDCDLETLAYMGATVFVDMARIARGELAAIAVPQRLPQRGEYSPDAWHELLQLSSVLIKTGGPTAIANLLHSVSGAR